MGKKFIFFKQTIMKKKQNKKIFKYKYYTLLSKNYASFLLSLAILLVFSIWYFTIGIKIINQPFIWDDLHLIRSYSSKELVQVWSGNWDPDQIETLAYRPVSILIYHMQYSIFSENTIQHRFFLFFLLIILLIQISKLLKIFNFRFIQIVIILSLLIFSKVFTLLSSWLTLTPLIINYIIIFFSIFYFISWIEKKKAISFLIFLISAAIAIFTREESYYLPALLFLAWLISNSYNKKNIKFAIFGFFITLLIVFSHIILRNAFVSNAPQPSLSFFTLKQFLMSIMASWLPGGWPVNHNSYELMIHYCWLAVLVVLIIHLLKNNKEISLLIKRKILILFALTVLLSTPALAVGRAFGILLPSLFALSCIVTISDFLIYSKISYKKLLKLNCLLIVLFISGIIIGFKRSVRQADSINAYSVYIVGFDTNVIYGEKSNSYSIPYERLNEKKKNLNNLGVYSYAEMSEIIKMLKINNVSSIEELIKKNKLSSKIYLPIDAPLGF
jgi:hypothetical protein